MITKDLKILEQLDLNKQAAFAYLTCERLYPNYVYFSTNFNFGNPAILRQAIDFLHLNIFKKNPDKNIVNTLIKEVEKNTPNTEDFSTSFVSSALDTCTCILDSLDFLIDKDFSKIISISTYAKDTVDMYIREIENIKAVDKNFVQKVNNHPLMSREIAIQEGIIAFLGNSKNFDYEDIQTLLHLQQNNKKSNLDL